MFDGKRVTAVLDDYLDGVAPPIPSIDLPIDTSQGAEVVTCYDRRSDIESWVFTSRGSDIGELFRRSGIRIFA